MAFSIEWTPSSEDELIEYTAYLEQFSTKKANVFVDKCFKKIALLQVFPFSGFYLENNIRRTLVDKNVALYYRVKISSIEILGFFDLRQNPEKNKFN